LAPLVSDSFLCIINEGLQSIRHKIIKWSLVVRVVLEAVIRTSWTNRNLGRHFYGCPTLVTLAPLVSDSFLCIINEGLQSIRHKIIKWSLVVRVVLEAVIRTSWTNRNLGRRFYGCPTLSPTCVNFLRRAIIEKLEHLPGNLVAYKTREHLKHIQKAVLVEVIELKKELCL
nr:hypothetical protein [Tanacetum cinerariifolium]